MSLKNTYADKYNVFLNEKALPLFLKQIMIIKSLCAGGEVGLRDGEESRSKSFDCTCGHGCFLRCCGDERLSGAEGQAHGCWIYEHAGEIKYYLSNGYNYDRNV